MKSRLRPASPSRTRGNLKKNGSAPDVPPKTRSSSHAGRKTARVATQSVTERKPPASSDSALSLPGVAKDPPNGLIVIDDDQRILSFNSAAAKMFGYSIAEIMGKSLNLLIPERNRSDHKKHVKEYVDSGLTKRLPGHTLEVMALRADGTEFPVEISISTSYISDKKSYIAVVHDLTERRQSENTIRLSELKYRALVEQLPMMVYTNLAEDVGFTTFISPQVESILGYTQKEWLENPEFWTTTLHPEDYARVMAEVERVHRTSEPFDLEYRMIAQDGRVLWFRDQAVLVQDREGNPPFWQGLMTDITEKKQMEEALRESEEHFRSVYENATIGLYRTTPDGQILMSNSALVKMLGFESFEELAKINLERDGSHAIYKRKEFKDRIERDGEIRGLESAWRRRDDAPIYVRESARVVRDAEGKTLYYEGTVEDITDRRKAEADLLQSHSLLQAAFESTADGLLVVDAKGKITYFNRQFIKMWGIPDSVIASRDDDQALSFVLNQLQNPDGFLSKVRELYSQPEAESFDLLEFKDGRVFERYSQPQRIGNEVVGRVWSFRDVTSSKQTQENLLASETELRALFAAIPDVILVLDKDGHYVKVAPTGADPLYVPTDEMLGKRMHDIFSQQKAEELVSHIHLALQTRRPVQFEYALLIEGHIVWFSGAAAPLTEDRVIWVARDITSQKQAEDQVERRLTDLEVLYESGISLSQSLDPRAVGEKVINVLAKRLNWHHAAVRIRRGDSDEVELLAFSQSQERNGKAQSNQMIARNAITKVGEGMTGWVIQHGRTINSGDLKSDPRYHETFPGMRSGLYVPIWAGGRTLGCISVESDQPELFNEADERLLTTLASQAASALENARLFESERLRRQDAETLRQAASAVSSSLDPQKVLDELLDGLAKVIAYDSSTVFILENKKIRAVSGRGLVAPEKVIGRLFPSDDTLTKEIMATHRPVALEDVQKDARFEDWGTDEPVRSWMGVPLMARGAPIGYLTLDRKEVAPYSEAEAEMALAFANHAAAAIENARLYQDAIRSAERRAALHTASQEIGQIGQDLEEIYASIHRAAERLMPTEAFAITLADEEHQEIEGVYLIDHGGRSLVMRLPSGKGLSGKVIEKGESILINDDLENQVEGIHFGSKEAVRSILAVPMRVGGRVIGMISAQSYQPNQYTEEDQYLLETLAAQAGVAIENTRLFKETTQRADQFAALYEVTRSVSSKRDLDNLLHTITEQAIALLSAGGGGIYLYNAEHEDLELITNVDSQVQPGIRLKLGEGAAGQVAVTREPIIIEDYQTWEGRSLQYQGQQIRAVLEVPMLHGGELLGVLTVEEHGESERKFTPTDASVLSLFAAHAASAIHNARLFEQITLRAGEFEALYQTASDVSLQGDLQTLLKTIIERARVLSLAQGASLYLFDSERGDLDLVAALDPDLRLGTRLEMGEGLAGRVAQLKEPVVVEDYQTWEHRSSKYQGFPVTSILGVPMLYSGELVGVLSVFNRAVGNEQGTRASLFTQHEADLLSLFANVAGGAVYSARLMDQTRRRLEELDALAKVSSALRTASTRNEMIPVILNQLREILHADSAIFTALNPDTHEIVVELAQGTLEVHTGLVIPPNEGLTARVIESRKVYVKSDFQSEPNVFAAHLLKDVRSVMIAPLATQERAIGALWVTREEREGIFPPPFAGHELNLMTSIADIAANAIQRASLHEQTTDYADQLVTINTIGHALSETLDLPGIYEKVSRSVLELLPDTANVYITLYDWQTRTIAPGYALREGRAADVSRMAPIKLDDVRDWNQAKVVSNGAPLVIPALDDHGTGMQSVHGWAAGDNPMGSALYVPLKAEGRVIGVLQLQSLTKNRYNQADASLLELIANTAGVAIQNTRLFSQLRRRVDQLSALHTVDTAIGSTTDLRVSLQAVLEGITRQLKVDAASVLLLNQTTLLLQYVAGTGFFTPEITHTSLPIGKGRAGMTALERQITRIPDLNATGVGFTRSSLISAERFVGYAAIPLIAKGEVKGVLELFHRSMLDLDQERTSFLEMLAGQAALAIDNALLFDSLEKANIELTMAYDATIEGWSQALELRDQETQGHSARVLGLTIRVATLMGVADKELHDVRRGVLLHDIGKMGIPDSILHKPGKLTDEEWEIMRKHPQYAHDMLAPIAYLRGALDIPYSHHEKWDGSGYPRALKGEAIPLTARIFAVVDVYDALTSDRPYREAWSKDKTLEYIRAESGKHFDPRVVEVFLNLMKS